VTWGHSARHIMQDRRYFRYRTIRYPWIIGTTCNIGPGKGWSRGWTCWTRIGARSITKAVTPC